MNSSYDAGESRRSPRDQSPGRYNDSRDEFRGGGARGGERRRSIPDARINHNSFASNRELFREPTGRDSSRDFNSSRDPPRGPKGFPDAPTGPRASSHSEFRGDFGGYRGDFRGERGRGRGRGWRDDSRDRGRELDREYRDRRDDRGPPPQFRDDRGRDRWGGREPYRGRRASSPQGRGRSPNYGPRDSRDAPPNIEIDRTRRGSRDGPLSGGSPGSDSIPPFGRGYSRAPRGGRGRGRGNFYEDGFHRPSGRSRSPEPTYRRTQPSATPPPQVPAFGSTAVAPIPSNVQSSSVAPITDNSGPMPGIAVPTAPRSHAQNVQVKRYKHLTNSVQWANSDSDPKKTESGQSTAPPVAGQSPPNTSEHGSAPSVTQAESHQTATDAQKSEETDVDESKAAPKPNLEVVSEDKEDSSPIRQGLVGKHGPEAPAQPSSDVAEAASESESEDEVNDAYFEDEISKIEGDTTKVNVENPQNPRPESPSAFMKPFRRYTIDRLVESRKAVPVQSCVAPEVKVEEVAPEAPLPSVPVSIPASTPLPVPVPAAAPISTPGSATIPDLPAKRASRSRSSTPIVPAKPKAPIRSRPSTPSLQPKDKQPSDVITNGGFTPAPAPLPSARTPLPSVERADSIPREPTAPLRSIEQGSDSLQGNLARKPTPKPATNGTAHKSVPMDVFSESEGDMTEAENEEMLEAVRPRMKTPLISSLPNFGNKKWFEDDEFLETLKPKPDVEARIRQKLIDDRDRKLREQQVARDEWGLKYHEYRRFTDFSDDPIAVRSREKFAKARAQAAAEAAAPHQSSVPSAGAKPEGKVRMGRWATEHDFERVLRESELEAKETKEKEDRAARAKTASAKEATIPDAAWDREEWRSMQHIDRTHLVPFERSFAILEFGEPIDNFTEEETEIFERVYLEFPKQWSKIAAALPRRDYKACIQHYYLIKHKSDLKDKLKRQPKKRKARQPKAKNPKPNALIADVVPTREDAEDTQDTEGGERRGRPRRAAAPTFSFETPASESEVASPAPTPGRKAAATPKGDTGTDAPPPKRKAKAPREKGSKQAKNSQLLAAAPPIAAATQRADSPATSMGGTEWKNRRDQPGGNARFPSQFDGPGPNQPSFAPPYAPIERPNPSMPINFDPMPQHFPPPPPPPPPQQERLDSAPPMSFDAPQDRRTIQQTSSYWSVPEQTDFPALLRHFGTDWHGIAKWMTSKTHIMVYTTVFQQWLAVPSDSNKSRRVANIQTQVKNYYQRQVDSGKKEWEMIAKDADEKRERNEPTGPLPTPTIIPKRRYDVTPGSHPRSSSAMEQTEEFLPPGPNSVMSQVSPPQPPSLSARFPALAQAGPVPQIQPATATTTVLNKHTPPQPIQQAPQQIQQQPRPTRGPPIGFFSTDSPSRPIVPNDAVSQRSLMVAQEAQIEKQSALRLEREQREQQQQREQREQQLQREQEQAIQREQEQKRAIQQRELAMQQHQREQQSLHRNHQFQMKQENETPNPNQYEQYSTPAAMLPGNQPHARSEPPKPLPPSEVRRTAPPQHHPQQYQPRSNPSVRPFLGESVGSARDVKSTPSPAVPRAPMSAPPANQEMYSAPPPQPPQQIAPPQQPAPVAVRQPEPARKSNIMSLLNDDEPSDPRPPLAKRASDVSTSSIQNTRTPPPQHPLHPSRYSTHPAQSAPQQHPHMSQQMTSQPPPQQQPTASQHGYSQPPQPQHPLHQHSSSIGHARSYTPTGFDNRSPYGQPQMQQQQQQQQQMYSQPRQSMTSQPSQLRREPSIGEMHGMASSGGYARSSAPSQPSMRLKESPYSAPTPPPQAPQAVRQSMGSPHDLPLDQRDYYQRQPQPSYFMQPQQQQQNATASPQLGPSYNSPSQQHQQPPATHRQLAFSQNSPHVPSPPAQYAQHHSLHNSRHNSFDGREGRYQMGSAAPGLAPAPAPAHAGIYRPYPGVPEVRTQRNDSDRNVHAMMDLRRETEARREAERREVERRDIERREAERQRY